MARMKHAQKLQLNPKTYVITGEDPAEFLKLANEFESAHKPTDVCERFLVEMMIIDTWRLRRYERALPHVQTRGTEKDINRLVKIINGIQRSIRASLADLQRMRKANSKSQSKTAPKLPQLDDSLPLNYYIN
jgi:hypothetical protein